MLAGGGGATGGLLWLAAGAVRTFALTVMILAVAGWARVTTGWRPVQVTAVQALCVQGAAAAATRDVS